MVVVADHEPVLLAVVVATAVVLLPSYNFTVDDAAAVPAKVGVLSLVVVPLVGLDIIGAGGAAILMVKLTDTEVGEVLPALSVAFAVIT